MLAYGASASHRARTIQAHSELLFRPISTAALNASPFKVFVRRTW
jgi:uncharacterized glyoxalase superfamily metalloenzyme YdcJ